MYVFSRHARLALGQTRAARMWATEITDRINQVTGLQVALYAQVMSAETDALDWGVMVPDLATLETAMDKLAVDDFFIAEQDRAAGFLAGLPTDSLQTVIHGSMDADAAAPEYTTPSPPCAGRAASKGASPWGSSWPSGSRSSAEPPRS